LRDTWLILMNIYIRKRSLLQAQKSELWIITIKYLLLVNSLPKIWHKTFIGLMSCTVISKSYNKLSDKYIFWKAFYTSSHFKQFVYAVCGGHLVGIVLSHTQTMEFSLVQGWAIVLARGPLCGNRGWRRAAPFKMIAFIS
jgi:hypothetical protein